MPRVNVKYWRMRIGARRRTTKPFPIAIEHEVLAQLLDAYQWATATASKPCQIGHLDKRPCFEHAHEFARGQWCEPCEAAFVLKGGVEVEAHVPKRKAVRRG